MLPLISLCVDKENNTCYMSLGGVNNMITKSHKGRLHSVTYQHLLELFYRLIRNTDAINFSDLISYMQSP